MQDLRIVFLGTSSATPSRTRGLSSVAVVLEDAVVLFDCGEGTQQRLIEAPVRSGAIDVICISHLHGDHLYGLPGLISTLSMNGRERPLVLIGAEGLRTYVDATFASTGHHPSFELQFEPLPYRGRSFTIEAAPLEHSVPSLGFRLTEDERPGKFDPGRAESLGIPRGPQWRELQLARDPRVSGPPVRGRSVVYVSDSRPCQASIDLAREADVLIHEATYGNELATEAHARGHSTAADAARIASAAGARRLILTHFSPRYGDVTRLVEEAREVFPNVDAASDLACFDVPRPL